MRLDLPSILETRIILRYSSLGASGAISAVMFVWILLNPTGVVALFFIPMPGWLVGILLLGVSFYSIQRKRKGTYSDGISHEAHFWGSHFWNSRNCGYQNLGTKGILLTSYFSFSMKGIKITFLGTGTSQGVPVIACKCAVCTSEDARDTRTRTSILVETEKTRIVIDTGPDFRQQCLRTKI